MCACTINALQGNVPAIKLALGVAILSHRTSFLANNVSTASALFIRMTGKSHFLMNKDIYKSNVSELVCQRDVCEALCFSVCNVKLYVKSAPARVDNVYGHTTLKAPVLVRSPKLSNVGPG